MPCCCLFITAPGKLGAVYCDQSVCVSSVCLCVCLSIREHISGTAGPIFTKYFMQIPCDRGSVLLWRRCDTLCTSGFMDDVMFGRMAMCHSVEGWIFNLLPLAALRYRAGV